MERLGRRDLRVLLSYVRDLYAWRDLDGFAANLVATLPKVVPSEWTSYNEFDSESRTNPYTAEPQISTTPEARCLLERHIHEHPLINHHRRTGDGRAVKVSDFLTQGQWHRLGLYNEFYKKVNADYKMSIVLRTPPPLMIGVVLNRSGKDFSDQDRLLLDLLRPHLAQAHQNAESVDRIRRAAAGFEWAMKERAEGMVVFTGKGRMQWYTAHAAEWLSEYFEPSVGPDHLPESLERWVEHQRSLLSDNGDAPQPRKPLVRERAGKRLAVRLMEDGLEDRHLLVLEEEIPPLSAARLEHLGLTRREAEILVFISRGMSDREIATTLRVSPRTVNKHLEHIYRKLEVGSRTKAVARALENLGSPRR